MSDLDEIVQRISLVQLRRYLISHGWRRPSDNRAAENIFALDDVFRIVLPASSEDSDASRRIRDAMRTLAGIRETDYSEMASEIQTAGYDVVRSTIPSEFIRDESVSLNVALAFTQEIKALLSSTASAEIKPLPFLGRVRKAGLEYSDACRFGHTFRGSFGFVVESPLPAPTPDLLEGLRVVPFERRVVQRFARGISAVVAAVATQSLDPITDGVRTGFNANGCEIFSNLITEVSPGRLDVAISFDDEIPSDLGPGQEVFKLGLEHAEAASEAARTLRRNDIDLPVAIVGLTIRLQNQTDPSDIAAATGEHEVVVLWTSEDYGDIQVVINLDPGDYLRAVSAHGAGRPVAVAGNLRKIGRKWMLADPRNFSVVGQIDLFN